MARRLGFVLVLVLGFLLLDVPFHGNQSSALGYVRSVSPVEAGTLPEPPGPRAPDMGRVWRRTARQEQLFPVIWTIDTQDYLMEGNPQGVIDNVARLDRAGRKQDRDQIVLMHDIHPQDAQALPGVIRHFERQDREFVGVNDILTDKYLEP